MGQRKVICQNCGWERICDDSADTGQCPFCTSLSSQQNTSTSWQVTKHTVYDPIVIQQFADTCYSYAGIIIAATIVIGAVVGAVLGVALGLAEGGGQFLLLAIPLALIGGGIGYLFGLRKTFLLKFLAQMALCLMHIEHNTRREANSSNDVSNDVD